MNLIYQLRDKGFVFWNENNSEHLSLKFNKSERFSEKLKKLLLENKKDLIQILRFNDITSERKFINTVYFKIPEQLSSLELSEVQKGIYLQSKLDKEATTYNISVFLKLNSIDIEVLEKAILFILSENRILRINVAEGSKYRFKNIKELSVKKIKLPALKIESYIKKRASYIFDLNNDALILPEIIIISNTEQIILNLTHHHLIGDAYSVDLLINLILNRYESLKSNKKASRAKSIKRPLDYLDYKEFQDYELGLNKYKSALLNLANKLMTTEPLFLKAFNKTAFDNIGNKFNVYVNGIQTEKLKCLANKAGVSLYAILLTNFYHTLQIYNENRGARFPIIITVSNRPFEFKYAIGPFISTMPFIFDYDETSSLLENIKLANSEILYLSEYNHININMVSHQIKNFNYNMYELMQVIFTMHNFIPATTSGKQQLSIPQSTEMFGLSVICNEMGSGLKFDISYANNLYSESYIKSIFDTFTNLLYKLDENLLGEQINKISLLSCYDYQKIVYDWNKSNVYFQLYDKTIHQLFEDQVKKFPNNIALIFKNTKLTYKELNCRSNQLANYLRISCKIKINSLIALYLDRSEFMVIAILAVLKSGGAYVPLDVNYPDDWVNHILANTQAKTILTNKIYKARLEKKISHFCKVKPMDYILPIDDNDFMQQLKGQNAANLNLKVKSDSLAYIIYTSGTTGNPKGVMQQHNNVVHLFTATDKLYRFNFKDVWTLFHSYVFDFSVWEIWGPLIYGGKLLIPDAEQIKNTKLFYELCLKGKVTVLNQTPKAFYQFIEVANNMFSNYKLSSLRYIILGGDVLHLASLKAWFDNYGYRRPKLVNMYGITETTVHVTYKVINKQDLMLAPSIGKAIPDKKLYVLNAGLVPLPIWAIGELYVGGVGIAKGYCKNHQLTKERFIANPFQTIDERNRKQRLYKTGDLVRLLPEGELEFVGRNDSQVKVRGYRIELNEIERVLSKYAGIKQAVVLAVDKGDSSESNGEYLVGYYVAKNRLNEEEILGYLDQHLPNYMVPNILIFLEKLPLTINGKLDRKKLLKTRDLTIFTDYVLPRNEIEAYLCEIYSQILGIPIRKVGAHGDFFKLGGNSILAIRLVTKLQHNFSGIDLAEVFQLRTPAKIAKSILFVKDNLRKKLELIKAVYKEKRSDGLSKEMLKKYSMYLRETENLRIKVQSRRIKTVLLTGATGHLGCHLLYQLLLETRYNIYLLVRGNSDEHAYSRANEKFKYYFDISLDNYQRRVIVFTSNLEKRRLGLDTLQYQKLADNVDSIIHAAALVKHYGDYEAFYQANVQATINLLELAKITKGKDFHYISTTGPLQKGYISEYKDCIFDENSSVGFLAKSSNVYIKTKYEGELATFEYRKYGVNSSIYRLGNLAMNSVNYKNQENIEENSFFIRTKTMLSMGMVPKEISKMEISPVDIAASAIIKLFNQLYLSNQIYHILNPYLCDLTKLFEQDKNLKVKTVDINTFVDSILKKLDTSSNNKQIELFMLHQQWLQDVNADDLVQVKIFQDRTNAILSKVNFYWPEITSAMLSNIIDQSFKS